MKLTKTLLKNIDNKDIIAYNVKFNNGFEVEILNLGGIITKIITPIIITLNFKNLHKSYLTSKLLFVGITY